MANKNKVLGSSVERHYAKEFREMGFKYCRTSRAVSTVVDNLGIDLVFVPFNIQIKAGAQKSLNYRKVLLYIKESLAKSEVFPSYYAIYKYLNITIHMLKGSKGRKRTPDRELVYMSRKDLNVLLERCKREHNIKPEYIEKRISEEKVSRLFLYPKATLTKIVISKSSKGEFGEFNDLAIFTFELLKVLISDQKYFDKI